MGNIRSSNADNSNILSFTQTILELKAGYNHTCARFEDGTLRCWGDNAVGQLGNGTFINSELTMPQSLDNTVGISAGEAHSCAIDTTGTPYCWGGNTFGQVNFIDLADTSTPIAQTRFSNALFIATGSTHSCAALDDNSTWCWGGNNAGQLGAGFISDYGVSFDPQEVRYTP